MSNSGLRYSGVVPLSSNATKKDDHSEAENHRFCLWGSVRLPACYIILIKLNLRRKGLEMTMREEKGWK